MEQKRSLREAIAELAKQLKLSADEVNQLQPSARAALCRIRLSILASSECWVFDGSPYVEAGCTGPVPISNGQVSPISGRGQILEICEQQSTLCGLNSDLA